MSVEKLPRMAELFTANDNDINPITAIWYKQAIFSQSHHAPRPEIQSQ
jgi:hypothetical protein